MREPNSCYRIMLAPKMAQPSARWALRSARVEGKIVPARGGRGIRGQRSRLDHFQSLAEAPHLLITDYRMPELLGDELIRNARQQFPACR